MTFSRFAVPLIVRVLILTMSLFGMTLSITATGYYAVSLLMLLVTVVSVVELYRYVNKTNEELARFFEAARYGDFGQSFEHFSGDAGFQKLAMVFDDIMQSFKITRQQQEEQLRHLKSLTEHMPVPLLSLYSDGSIKLHNNAARQLFSKYGISRIEDMSKFGESFKFAIEELEPGNRRLVSFVCDGIERQLALVSTQIVAGEHSEKLVSMQDIQSELDDVQLQAWQELVGVLTHEIMNSITPITSLAETASDLVKDVGKQIASNEGAPTSLLEDVEDVQGAVQTVAKRSQGLMQFVQSYRSLTQLPEPKKERVILKPIFDRVADLLRESCEEESIDLEVLLETEDIQLGVDADMLEQILINLLRNAVQALSEYKCEQQSKIRLSGTMNSNSRVCIVVSDNGPGIPSQLVNKIFIPFFTTKRDGSGVGLALTRQIMIAHGGNVTLSASKSGGAEFTLIF